MTQIALIGYGVMGAAAADKLLESGHTVTVTDPAPGTEQRAKAAGLSYSMSPDTSSSLVLLLLPAPAQIREVMPELVETGNRIIVDHSTSDPQTAREMADLALQNGCGWIDAPILGRPGSAGKWALPIGATPGALDECSAVLQCYASNIFDMGEPGSGHQVKLLNQMMFGAINAMTAEMMAISHRLGLPPGKLYEIITASQAGTVSNLFKELGSRIAKNDFTSPTFSVKLLEKDIRLGLEMAQEAGVEPQLGKLVDEMNRTAIAAGKGDEDTAGMWRVLAER